MEMLKYVASVIGGLLLFVGIAFGAHQIIVSNTPADYADSVVLVKIGSGHGTGFYIGNNEFITAAHVAREAGPDSPVTIVSDKNPDNPVQAQVMWLDNERDVAMLRVVPNVSLLAAKLLCGPTDKDAAIGTAVESVGYPLGLGLVRVEGRVAGKRHADSEGTKTITVNVSIAPGNSGGPLFDRRGSVVGLADAVPIINMGFGLLAFPTLAQYVPRSEICVAIASHTPTVQASK